MVWGGLANYIIKKQDEKYADLLTASNIRARLVERLVDAVDDMSKLRQIHDDYEFDYLVKDLKDPGKNE
jgi:Xaa-Pro aminopeptidase